MKTIDSHQHFWRFDPLRDSWINDEMGLIRKDFLPEDLAPVLRENNVDGCVAIQADQSEKENTFLLELAAGHPFIKGIVGWVDLMAGNIKERLGYYQQYGKMKGFRHILQSESNRVLMLEPDFKKGIGLLQKYGFTYDILILPDQIKYIGRLVKEFPEQTFVLDHLAKPNIKENKFDTWAAEIDLLARYDNIYCKASGMVTEADWKKWAPEHFTRYLDIIFESFGTKRVMFGSDWPVCQLAATYGQVKDIVYNYTQRFSADDRKRVFGGNAMAFYNL